MMADDIFEPATTPDEPSTRFLDATGNERQRVVREMTVGEVMAVWHRLGAASDRMDGEYEAAKAILDDQARQGSLRREESAALVAMMSRAADALEAEARFHRLVTAIMPQWQRHEEVPLPDALRRWWPDPPGATALTPAGATAPRR
jgi:hypothetical protein